MKKYVSLLVLLTLLTCCNRPESRSWIIPVTIDPSDLSYTPGQMESFELRRNEVLSMIDEGFVVLKSGAGEHELNRHQFRPNNYFYYMTGFESPNSYVILSKEGTHPYTLSLPPYHIRSLIYGGGIQPDQEIRDLYGPDRLISFSELRILLDSILGTGAPVYIDRSDRDFLNQLERRFGDKSNTEFHNVADLVDELRVIKGSMEVERLQKACNITSKALTNVMRECEPGMYEFEMESIIEGTFLQYGASMPGFPSIVGSGPNSTILHYEPNNQLMENGDVLLMDIGAEYGYYTADITRTIPVNGRFTPEQKTIYQLVLDGQKAAIKQMVAGNMIGDGHTAAMDVILPGLFELGLITDSTAAWQAEFYILYRSSHYLGLDVHDVGDYGGFFARSRKTAPGDPIDSRVMEPGMVLTIEPGLYFREKGLEQVYEMFGRETDSTEIAAFVEAVAPEYEKYLNIGVRIEDDILITEEGNINLSRYAPKEIRDIEQLMR